MKNPFDPLGVAAASAELWRAMLENPANAMQAQLEFGKRLSDVALATTVAAPLEGEAPVPRAIVAPEPGDRRFANEAWANNPYFDALKQAYLLATKAVMETIETAEGIDPTTRRRIRFFAKQFCDAMSPTNIPWMNPEVLEATLRTGGANLQLGLQNVEADLKQNEGRAALVDASAFEVGRNVATTPGKVVFRNELIELIQYTPTQPEVFARPLVIVPPWINKFYILDLQPENSFVKYALDAGRNTFVISWRNPDSSMRHLTMADYLRLGPLTASRVAAEIAGSRTVDIIGYCIGGTLTAMLLAYVQRMELALINTATFFAALVDFTDPGDIIAFLSDEALAHIDEQMKEHGFLSGREMADTFNMLRSNDLIWSVAVNRYLLGKGAPAFDLLYWNSDATRIPAAVHSYYLRRMYRNNDLIKVDALDVDGVPIDLHRVTVPTYCVATSEDHIAPWRSVYAMTQLFSGDTTFRLGASGHIAGIISQPGKKKAAWWGLPLGSPNPPAPDAWFTSAAKHDGSWWPDWTAWLAARSGEKAAAVPSLGSDRHQPLADAPGTYVLER
ncbi:MAG: class I poly(R)-hydroxyalkanoic acid synthase [Candidatus Elarobacter sp.]